MKTTSINTMINSLSTLDKASGTVSRDLLDALARLEDAAIQQRLLKELVARYVILEQRVDGLLKNTLPKVVAEEIKFNGHYPPRPFDCTIMFMDCAGFTNLAERIPAEVLIARLHELFLNLDQIVDQCQGVKIKTIGDAYMAVFGAPIPLPDHGVRAVQAGLDSVAYLERFNVGQEAAIEMRVGIHSGQVMGAVVGRDRMQFDIFGDNVNIASRFESSGEKGRVNISDTTHRLVRESFICEPRGEIPLKNKTPMLAFFVNGPRPLP